jgi:hypothetical protein
MYPTKFETVNKDKGQFVIMCEEINLGDQLDKKEIDFKMDPEVEKKPGERNIDALIRMEKFKQPGSKRNETENCC